VTNRQIAQVPLHLGLGATAIPLPAMTGGMEWYEAYGRNHAADGAEGRLVASHDFTESWDSWEMHPAGEEVVICLEGEITLIQELLDGSVSSIHLAKGDYAINPRGVWHTADVSGPCSALFITAGMGTQARPR
jgi:mannose-6-phosphate isomerase-like protein (cupin superfamily)